jgi:hypothetical protein
MPAMNPSLAASVGQVNDRFADTLGFYPVCSFDSAQTWSCVLVAGLPYRARCGRPLCLGVEAVDRPYGDPDGDMARGELIRFFAGSPWYPTELLPSQGVQRVAVDAASAKATIVDGTITLTLLFHFNEAGLIDWVRAEARGGMVGKKMLMRPWECGLSDYQVRDGMMVPFLGTAAWVSVAVKPQSPPLATTLMFVGSFGPSLAAVFLVANAGGRAGLRAWLGLCLKWRHGSRQGWLWLVFALLFPGLLMALAASWTLREPRCLALLRVCSRNSMECRVLVISSAPIWSIRVHW